MPGNGICLRELQLQLLQEMCVAIGLSSSLGAALWARGVRARGGLQAPLAVPWPWGAGGWLSLGSATSLLGAGWIRAGAGAVLASWGAYRGVRRGPRAAPSAALGETGCVHGEERALGKEPGNSFLQSFKK